MMRQVWITGPETVEVRQVPVPEPGAGEVLVRMAYAGICGSDLHTLRRGHPWLPYPIPPGHEASGVVEALGAGAEGFRPGEAVYLRPAISCGQCFYCRRGRENLCEALIGVGSHRPGAFADWFTVPVAALAQVPLGVSLGAAALIEPLATGVHAVTIAASGLVGDGYGVRLAGATVAVLGGGTIGQCLLIAALGAGAGAVVVTDPVERKRSLAVAQGAKAAFEPHDLMGIAEALDGRPDVVFDCVASAASLRAAVEMSVRGGSVVVVGVGHGPVEMAIETIQDHEVRIAGSAMYLPADFDIAGRLAVGSERLVTSIRPLAEAGAAMRAAASGTEVKIHLSGTWEEEGQR